MNQNSLILKQGYKKIGIAFAISIFSFLFLCDSLGFLVLFIALFITYSYRNPIIGFIPKDEAIVLSPIEGKISAIDRGKHTYKVYIDVNLCNTHILRAPKTSKMSIKKLIHGINLCHNTYKAKKLNSRAKLKFDDISVKLLSGLCNTDLEFIEEKKVLVGEEIGLFFHGSVMVEIPLDKYKLTITLGQKVSSETILANSVE